MKKLTPDTFRALKGSSWSDIIDFAKIEEAMLAKKWAKGGTWRGWDLAGRNSLNEYLKQEEQPMYKEKLLAKAVRKEVDVKITFSNVSKSDQIDDVREFVEFVLRRSKKYGME